jgi:hypothetical protein
MKTSSIPRAIGVGLAVGLVALTTVVAFGGGCGGPYKGKPDKLPKVKKVAHVDVDAAPTEEKIAWDDKCSAKFGDDPAKAYKERNKTKGNTAAAEGDDKLSNADKSDDPPTQITLILEAIKAYKDALLADNYNADATYGLAVAYAKVRKKGCALKMLKRLAELEQNPKLPGQSKLKTILDSVEDEPAFAPFQVEALAEIGR